jgi:hypothetical protein
MKIAKTDLGKLNTHIRLCKRNLHTKKVKCCANCPFEEIIVRHYPETRELFEQKRKYLGGSNEVK